MISAIMNSKGIKDTRITSRTPLVSPVQLSIDIAQPVEHEEFVRRSRKTIEDIMSGRDERIIIIVGPCSINDKYAAIEYARKLKSLSDEVKDKYFIVMRTYFEKPRTTLGWKGLINDPDINATYKINDGLRLARTILQGITDAGLPCATEYVNSLVIPDYTAEYISWAAIGARTVESQEHRELVSGLSMPVGFKNDRFGNIEGAIDAVLTSRGKHTFIGTADYGGGAIIETKGHDYTHIILRGGKEPNYERTHVIAAQEQLRKAKLPDIVMIDCSHGNSNKDYKNQPIVFNDIIRQRRDGNNKIIGIMVESNHKEGQYKLPEDLREFDKTKMPYGVSCTDSCMGWDDTVRMIKNS